MAEYCSAVYTISFTLETGAKYTFSNSAFRYGMYDPDEGMITINYGNLSAVMEGIGLSALYDDLIIDFAILELKALKIPSRQEASKAKLWISSIRILDLTEN